MQERRPETARSQARQSRRGRRAAAAGAAAPAPRDQAARARRNLDKVDHIVVLMLENRSFDHMLGYLHLEAERDEVDGLASDMANTFAGETYPVFHLDSTVFAADPRHDAQSVALQIGPRRDMSGFVESFAAVLPSDPGKIMGYYNAGDLPTYDLLAREYSLCQRWFASFPGPTWVNRLYALAGHSEGETENRLVPIYDLPTFPRALDAAGVSWKWYPHDVSTLRLVDGHYRIGHAEHFAYVASFYQDAADGTLPSVSWIDPNFQDLGGTATANDDHPPTDVQHAQALIWRVYRALLEGPLWEKTLLLVTYDEHGGFFDHVPPPLVPSQGVDGPAFVWYGVRVPALVVSPWVERGAVSSVVFDHTSILSTILHRFCEAPDGSIPFFSRRAAQANHVGWLLTQARPRTATTRRATTRATRRVEQHLTALHVSPRAVAARAVAAATVPPTDLQQQISAAKQYLRAQGHPEGQP